MRNPIPARTVRAARRPFVTTLAGGAAAVGVALFLSVSTLHPAAADTRGGDNRSGTAGAAANGTGRDNDLTSDIELMQGMWEREMRPDEKVPYKRTVKQIDGNREYVVYYDADGKVYTAHAVQFRVERYGPVKVFTFFNHEVTEGKDKGKVTPEERSYIYRVTKDEFAEMWGFLPGQESRPITYHVHKKVKNPAGLAKDGRGAGSNTAGPAGTGEAVPAAGRDGAGGKASEKDPSK